MSFKIKAWHVFLIGLGVVLCIGLLMEDPALGGSLFGEYLLFGGIGLGGYYLWRRLSFRIPDQTNE